MADRVRHYSGERPLFSAYGVEAAVRSTMDRRVPLTSGGYLVIDDTEAMTVIDVNSGRNVGKGGNRLEDTITKTNPRPPPRSSASCACATSAAS